MCDLDFNEQLHQCKKQQGGKKSHKSIKLDAKLFAGLSLRVS